MEQETLATETNETATDAVESSVEESQAQRQYSQKEFDDAMAKTRAAAERRALKPYQDLGDLDEIRTYKSELEQRRVEEQKSRGEYDEIIKDLASRKDAEIAKRDGVIAQYRIETPLTEAAARYKAVAPEQVKSLLRNNVRLAQSGDVEVVDKSGSVRYTESGDPMRVDDLVKTFLDANPHFVSAGPITTASRNSIQTSSAEALDVSKLDMSNPEHRKQYAEWRNKNNRR